MPEDGGERREIRILCQINVVFRLNFQNCYGTCKNLGLHGMFIGFDGEVTEGEPVELSFMLSGTGSCLVEASGKVIWVNSGPKRNCDMPEGFGVEFIDMSEESRELVRGFIDQCSF